MFVTLTYRRWLVFAIALALAVGSQTVESGAAKKRLKFDSAGDAYKDGVRAHERGRMRLALTALKFAADNGHVEARWSLARIYAKGDGVKRDEAKAFHYYRLIADRHADVNPSRPAATIVANAFVELATYYRRGIKKLGLKPNPRRAAHLYSHAASYFGDATAQYQLAKMYLKGQGVAKNARLAARWLANAAKKQHAAAQAILGDLLWRGQKLRRRPIKGLALLTVARANATKSDAKWIRKLYRRAMEKAPLRHRSLAKRLAEYWTGQTFESDSGTRPAAGATPRQGSAAPVAKPADRPVATAEPVSATGQKDSQGAPKTVQDGFRNVGTTGPTTMR